MDEWSACSSSSSESDDSPETSPEHAPQDLVLRSTSEPLNIVVVSPDSTEDSPSTLTEVLSSTDSGSVHPQRRATVPAIEKPTTSDEQREAEDADESGLEDDSPYPPPSPTVDTTGLNATLVAPNIIVADRDVAENPEALRRMGVTHVVTVDTIPLRNDAWPSGDRFSFHFMKAQDELSEDILLKLPALFQFMKTAVRTLFHCRMGVSRSAAVCIAYLMYRDNRSLEDVCSQVCRARSQCEPNEAFMGQLQLFQRMGFGLNNHDRSFQLYCLSHLLLKVIENRFDKSLTLGERMEFYKYLPLVHLNITCKKCRARISSTDRIVHHKPEETKSWYSDFDQNPSEGENPTGAAQGGDRILLNAPRSVLRAWNRTRRSLQKQSRPPQLDKCRRSIFIIPGEQILANVYKLYDNIKCMRCHDIVGKCNWLSVACECGGVCKPGFLLYRRKVDIPHNF